MFSGSPVGVGDVRSSWGVAEGDGDPGEVPQERLLSHVVHAVALYRFAIELR